jgi:hypothetical protein
MSCLWIRRMGRVSCQIYFGRGGYPVCPMFGYRVSFKYVRILSKESLSRIFITVREVHVSCISTLNRRSVSCICNPFGKCVLYKYTQYGKCVLYMYTSMGIVSCISILSMGSASCICIPVWEVCPV